MTERPEKVKTLKVPEISELQEELKKERHRQRYAGMVRSTVGTLAVVAAFAILVATLWMPVMQIYGTSMAPTLKEGQIVVAVKDTDFKEGDLVAFYIGNKLLVKRVVAGPGDTVSVDVDGTLYVNYQKVKEPYVKKKSLGRCDIDMPYVVPETQYFILGDNREVSLDSRSSAIGCIAQEQIVGRVVFSVWPLKSFGTF